MSKFLHPKPRKVAIVHDYLYQFGGAEKVIEKLIQIFPESDIYTSLWIPKMFSSSETFKQKASQGKIYTSYMQWFIPYFLPLFKAFFWLYSLAMSMVTVKDYDLVIISSTYCAKNVRLINCKKIIHYCHAPTRFLYPEMKGLENVQVGFGLKNLLPFFTFWLRFLDQRASRNLIRKQAIWLGNSNYISNMCHLIYGVKAKTLYPPVEITKFLQIKPKPKDYYLYLGRISFHKRVDLVIQACIESGKKLVVVGGSALPADLVKLKKLVQNLEKNNSKSRGLITFAGRVGDDELITWITGAKALIFPPKEDFGISPIESLASGLPVIAYQAGGALEYIRNGENGIFFSDQTVASLKQAIKTFENSSFSTEVIKNSVKEFSEENFTNRLLGIIQSN